MVTSTVHVLKYVQVVVEGSQEYYKCSLCPRSYPPIFFCPDVRDHLVQAHYSAIGVVFDNEDDVKDDEDDNEGDHSRIDLDMYSDARWEGHGDYEGHSPRASDSEEVKEREGYGDGNQSGSSNAEIYAAGSVSTAMSWPQRKKEEVDAAVYRWMYAHLIPFNVLRNPFFKEMVEAITKAGRNCVISSPSRLESLLTDEEKKAIDKRKKAINKKRKRKRMW